MPDQAAPGPKPEYRRWPDPWSVEAAWQRWETGEAAWAGDNVKLIAEYRHMRDQLGSAERNALALETALSTAVQRLTLLHLVYGMRTEYEDLAAVRAASWARDLNMDALLDNDPVFARRVWGYIKDVLAERAQGDE